MLTFRLTSLVSCVLYVANAASIPWHDAAAAPVANAQLLEPFVNDGSSNATSKRFLSEDSDREIIVVESNLLFQPKIYTSSTIEPRAALRKPLPQLNTWADLYQQGGDDTWITTVRVLIDRSGGDFGIHCEISGSVFFDYNHNRQVSFYQKLPKNKLFKINENDHGRELFEWVVSSQGRPVLWKRLFIREFDFFHRYQPGEGLVNTTREPKQSDEELSRIMEEIKETGEERCFTEYQGDRKGYAIRLTRCIQYWGLT